MTRLEIAEMMGWEPALIIDGVNSGTNSILDRVDTIVARAQEEERYKIIDILLRLHERAADSHNHYLYAVNVIEGKI